MSCHDLARTVYRHETDSFLSHETEHLLESSETRDESREKQAESRESRTVVTLYLWAVVQLDLGVAAVQGAPIYSKIASREKRDDRCMVTYLWAVLSRVTDLLPVYLSNFTIPFSSRDRRRLFHSWTLSDPIKRCVLSDVNQSYF